MNRILRSLVPALAAFALFVAPLSAQDNVSGAWIMTIDSPDGGGLIEIPFTFAQDGTTVTGTVDLSVMPQVQASEITEGVLEDGILFFVLSVGAEGQWMSVEVEAEVNGDEMVGEVYIAEMGQLQPFTAKRVPSR
ncbi:MAG: hypothetical protein OEN56_08215 [Gemmatimonadota bacterium]|nr:hypothetical protein [Gemmatimonadota bacterium]